MKPFKVSIILLILPFLFSCNFFLGPEADTSPQEILKNLWHEFDIIHANLDFRMSNNTRYANWHDVYHNRSIGFATRVHPGMSEDALFSVCANMLRELNDPHVGLFAPGRFVSSYTEGRDDFSLPRARDYLRGRGFDNHLNYIYGTFSSEPDIGYIYIMSFIVESITSEKWNWGRAIDDILESLSNTKALVLDVRSNRGGDILIMEYIAARFASAQKDYLQVSIKSGPGRNEFSPPRVHSVKPAHINYTKPIVLLTNSGTASAAERFTLALLTQNHVVHAGTTTIGALSVRIIRPMVNGWYYSTSPEKVMDINGVYYEGIGIPPKAEYTYEYGRDDDQIVNARNLAVRLIN